jgi:molybdopterin converting factor small subunit
MKVAVEFFGVQRTYANTCGIEIPIHGHTTVNDVIEYVRHNYPGLPVDNGTVHIVVNQKIASLDTVLAANDTVAFLPSIHGG